MDKPVSISVTQRDREPNKIYVVDAAGRIWQSYNSDGIRAWVEVTTPYSENQDKHWRTIANKEQRK